MRLIDADALRQVLEVFTEKDTLGHTPLQLCDAMTAASPWYRAEEPPKEDGWYILGFLSRWKGGNWWIPNFPDYWMTAYLPKEDADGNK